MTPDDEEQAAWDVARSMRGLALALGAGGLMWVAIIFAVAALRRWLGG